MKTKSAVVIIPAIGFPLMRLAVESVLSQSHEQTTCLVVIDGKQYEQKVRQLLEGINDPRLAFVVLPANTGANGFNGHRIYAAFAYLVNEDYVFYLDEDNWFEPTHVQSLVELMESDDLQWAYSLRKIMDREGVYLFNDDCQSLGKWPTWDRSDHGLVDTSCYCIRREIVIHTSVAWNNKLIGDRFVFNMLKQHFPSYDTTGLYTLNYRIGSVKDSVPREYLEHGNKVMRQRFPDGYPWARQMPERSR